LRVLRTADEIMEVIQTIDANAEEYLRSSWEASAEASLGLFQIPEGSFNEVAPVLHGQQFEQGYIRAVLVQRNVVDEVKVLWFPSREELYMFTARLEGKLYDRLFASRNAPGGRQSGEQPNEMTVECPSCKYRVRLGLVGGQYQYTWKGMCDGCGTMVTLSTEEDEE